MLESYNARQMADLKRVAANSFDNDFGNMRTAVVAVGQYFKKQ
jgi:hypothetical protein